MVKVKIEQFEGPLDLLLHLIHENKYDIFDIPILEITDQYMAALQAMQEFDMEVATEFLVMSATLLQIKSRLLLPKLPAETDGEEDEQDPRQVLIEMLLEYRKIKGQAAALTEMKAVADKQIAHAPIYTRALVNIAPYTLRDLLLALAEIGEERQGEVAYIEPQAYSVEVKMRDIVERLCSAPGGVLLSDFFTSGHRAEKIASFLGLLELLKAGKVIIEQKVPFAPIYIFTRKNMKDGV
ncbi:MAG: segregation/condensation protein A [Acidaminococcaceae bacterium]|nr:segregation/condensation protein A [Acidaminococcaceae bacterium]